MVLPGGLTVYIYPAGFEFGPYTFANSKPDLNSQNNPLFAG
jgi:hypothetical protein